MFTSRLCGGLLKQNVLLNRSFLRTTKRGLSKDIFEQRPSSGSKLFSLVGNDFAQMFGKIVSLREKTFNNTKLVALRNTGIILKGKWPH